MKLGRRIKTKVRTRVGTRGGATKKYLLNQPKFKIGDQVVFTGVAIEKGHKLIRKGTQGVIVRHWTSHFALRDVHFYDVRLGSSQIIHGVGEYLFGRRIIKKA